MLQGSDNHAGAPATDETWTHGVSEAGAVAAGLPGDDAESRLIENRDAVRDFFQRWADAGAGILLAPTLNATPNGLKPLGVTHHCWEVNRIAVETLREAADASARQPLVAAQLGPFSFDPDTPHVPFDRIYAQYHEQTKPLVVSGVDVMVVRRIDDLRHLRAALVALRELWDGPIVVVAGGDLSSDAPSRRSFALTLESFQVTGLGLGSGEENDERGGAFSPVDVASLGGARTPVCEIAGVASRAKVERALASGFQLALVDSDPFDSPPACAPVIRDEGIFAPWTSGIESISTLPAGNRCALVPVFGNEKLSPEGLENVLHAVGDSRRWSWIGFDLEAGDAPCRLYDAEFALSCLETSTGRPLAGRAADPRVLEVTAKASSSMPLLLFRGNPAPDYECALYVVARYGAMGVVDPWSVDDGSGDPIDALRATASELERWARGGRDVFREGRVAVDLTSLAARLARDPDASARLAELRVTTGLRWALESPGHELLESEVDLVLERVRSI